MGFTSTKSGQATKLTISNASEMIYSRAKLTKTLTNNESWVLQTMSLEMWIIETWKGLFTYLKTTFASSSEEY